MSKKYAGPLSRHVYRRMVGVEMDGEKNKRQRLNN